MKPFLLFLLLALFVSCTNPSTKKVSVDFTDTLSETHNSNSENAKAVQIAIASMTSPKETYTYYSELINYLSEKVGHSIYIKQKKTYEEVNMLLENSQIDFAFICSGAFVDEYERNKIKLLVAPQIDDKIYYQAYIIAHKESDIESFADFRNKKFAFTDPLSNTGRLYPLEELAKLNEKENDFFLKSVYTYGHDVSIQMVNHGLVDGASVHSLIFNYLSHHYPDKVENIKIVKESENFGMPPVVTPVSLSDDRFNKYRQIFLNMHSDSIGKSILDKLEIDKFVIVEDTIYDSVIQLCKQIENEK